MRIVLLLIAMAPAWAQFGAAVQVVNGNGVPNPAYCASANNVGMVYARKDGAAANTTFYVCSNTGASTYEWALVGGSSGDVGGGSNLTTSGAVPYVSAAATLDEDGSFLRVATGQYTLYDPTAVTGTTKLIIRDGAGDTAQRRTLEFQSVGGTTQGSIFNNGVLFGLQVDNSSPALSAFVGSDRKGFYVPASGGLGMRAFFDNEGLVSWSTDSGVSAADIGLSRNAAGIVEVNSGTRGTLRDLIQRHPLAGGTSPTITSGFGTTPSIAGKDAAGRVTVGTGGSAATGTITFGTAWATAPVCTAANETTQLALFPTATTTTLVLASTTPFTAADKLVYQCVGY